ncbi:MAG: hypothetical protein ABIF10_03885 [Candidatus Woesearchaeota archaeon]
MTFMDEFNKFCTVPEDTRIIREYKDKEGREITEIIPAAALAEYNRLLENMQRMGMRSVSEVKELARR